MHFHYPNVFYALIPFGLLILLAVWSRWRRRRDIQALGEWGQIKRLIPVESLIRRNQKDIWMLIGILLLIFCAAGPQFGARLKEVKMRGVDVFIAMDTSRSMLAEDITPSRMARAKRALSLLIKKLEGNRVGIIAFAKFAVIQCPLTVDNQAAQMFLEILDTNAVPIQGTSLGDAIRLAIKSFPEEEKGGKAIVLLTDGEDHESNPLEAAKEAKENGIVIFTIGIGSSKGDVIKKRDERGKVTEFHKYKGEMVLSRLDDALLTKIAQLTGGDYFRASSTDKEIDEIASYLNEFDKREFSSKVYQRYKERYQPFLLVVFLLLLIEFLISERRGQWARIREWHKRLLAAFGLLLILPMGAWADVKSHVIKGNNYIKKGDFEAARGEFESAQIDEPEAAFLPYNIANTYYLEGDFEEAMVYYDQAFRLAQNNDLKSKIAYNQAHLTFNKGDRDGAIEKFKECLKLNPNDVDAKYNIEYIQAGKTPKNPMPQKKEQDDKKKGKSGDKGDKNQEDQQKGQGEQKKDGELSKEDADRVLQLIQGQEKENLKNQKPLGAMQLKDKEKKKDQMTYEDW